ncbi:apolipoprotein C-IV isoform X2 [Cyprinodon tularosa]|nr:apolipoprotein C-IV isoform X2 [Cyprinodon tularosa]
MRLQIIFIFMFLLQAWRPALAQTAEPEQPDSRGILERLAERAGQARSKIKSVGETVMGFAGAYYEDHIQPVAGTYVEWASNMRNSLWEKVRTAVGNYMPSSN